MSGGIEDPLDVARREGLLLDGWQAIADELGCKPSTARKHAKARVDPLPVWYQRATGNVVAHVVALREWKRRGLVPHLAGRWWQKSPR